SRGGHAERRRPAATVTPPASFTELQHRVTIPGTFDLNSLRRILPVEEHFLRTPALPASARTENPFDVLCLSHLRWDFVLQRPQHLLSRWARQHRVFYVEEPVAATSIDLELRTPQPGVEVAVP